jgi:purine nucleoside phosphorylase
VAAPTAPSDFVEFTDGRFTTFFAKIGTGYVQQAPPFCPELRAALLSAGAADGGNLLIVDELPQTAVRQWWHEHDIELISTHSQPEGALCRELEMCLAVVAVPGAMAMQEWLTAVAHHLPAPRSCDCGSSMAFARKMGRLPEDWREWIISNQ